MRSVHTKRERERQTVEQMIRLYCRKKHRSGRSLCAQCEKLLSYSRERNERCRFREQKPFCSNCHVHCYRPDMRDQIRAVMRYAGPRMLLHHPAVAVRH